MKLFSALPLKSMYAYELLRRNVPVIPVGFLVASTCPVVKISDAYDFFVSRIWALPLEMPRLPTSVASLTHSSTGVLGGLLSWHSTGTGGMPLLVAFFVM